MSDDQPLRQPLLASRGVGSLSPSVVDRQEQGFAGSKSHTGDGGNSRGGSSPLNSERAGLGEGGEQDSFVYHVVRSQRERTETTI